MDADFDPSGFDGVWRTDRSSPGELVEIRHDGDVVQCRSRIDHGDDLSLFLGYSCRYGADEWVPYTVLHIEGDPDHERLRPNAFRKVHARVGRPIAYLKQVYVDPRTIFRVTKHPDGTAQYGAVIRLSGNGQELTASVVAVDVDAPIVQHLVRDAGSAPDWPKSIRG
jgi:hypothetical protein